MFCRSQTLMHGKITERHFPTLIHAKEQQRRSSTQLNRGKAPLGSDPGPAQGLPREDGGKRWWSRGGQPLVGASLPVLALAVACLHAKAVQPCPRAKTSLKHRHPPCINIGVELPSRGHMKRAKM